MAEDLKRYVGGGGVLVLTARSGVKNESNAVVSEYLPGLLAELAGAHVEEYDSLPEGLRVGLDVDLPGLERALSLATLPSDPLCATTWCDVLASDGAQVVAHYSEEHYAGKPAITLNSYGKGKVVYIGALGPAALFDALAPWLLALAGVQPVLHVPAGVEATERWQGKRCLLFVLNHTGQEQEITLDRDYHNLLDGERVVGGRVSLPAREVMILT
jgi:beta-galactosidase